MPKKSNFKTYWTVTSEKDINDIIDYFLNKEEIKIAKHALQKIKKSVDRLSLFPHSGRIVPELKHFSILIYREVIIENWRVIYKVNNRVIYIMAVIDSRRNVEDILLNRLVDS